MSRSKGTNAKYSSNHYAAPTLKIYGGVIDLTASGSTEGPEGTGTGNIFKKR